MAKLSHLSRRAQASAAPVQYAALPWRRAAAGQIEILLVTSRGTGRWVIPKGWPVKGKSAHASAEQEAWEEAGVVGRTAPEPVGAYGYAKGLSATESVDVAVEVFPLEVASEKPEWPERAQRERRWVAAAQAAELVDEPELRSVILGFDPGKS